MAASVAIVLNPRAGNAPERQELESAARAGGLDADVYVLPPTPLPSGWIDEISARHDVIVAAGGDGTASTVAASVVQLRKRFGVIPTGTLNHFARDVGIPTDITEALGVLAAGHTRLLDAAEVNGHVFLNNVSIGAYPRLLWERHRAREKGLPRHLAVTAAVIQTWLQLRSVTVRLCVDGEERIRRTPFVFIGNSEYEVEGTQLGKRRHMTDGLLSLYVAPDGGRMQTLMLPIRALLRTLKTNGDFLIDRAAVISIDLPRRAVSVAIDGEAKMLRSPLRFRIRRQALPTIVPAPAR